jgi:hypothetical protein
VTFVRFRTKASRSTPNAIVRQGRLDAGDNLLNKPYALRDLADKDRRVIDQAATRSPTPAA